MLAMQFLQAAKQETNAQQHGCNGIQYTLHMHVMPFAFIIAYCPPGHIG
jgi:hypothetical protein